MRVVGLEVLPASSRWVTERVWLPSPLTVAVQLNVPAASTTAEQTGVAAESSRTCTVAPGSPVPLTEKVVVLCAAPAAGVVTAGAAGAVASRFTVTGTVVVPPMLVVEQVMVWPAVSTVTVTGAQVAGRATESGSLTVNVTLTSLTYQPLSPRVPVTSGSRPARSGLRRRTARGR